MATDRATGEMSLIIRPARTAKLLGKQVQALLICVAVCAHGLPGGARGATAGRSGRS